MPESVTIDYTNYRGERRYYHIMPHRLHYGATSYHPQPQWLLEAIDEDRRVERTFAMKDIHSWTPKSRNLLDRLKAGEYVNPQTVQDEHLIASLWDEGKLIVRLEPFGYKLAAPKLLDPR